MFSQLANYRLKRNTLQAIGFYIVYSLLGLLICAVAGVVMGSLFTSSFQTRFSLGINVGAAVAAIYFFALYAVLCTQKKLTSFTYILLGVIGCIITFFSGIFVGFIFVAILATKEDRSSPLA